MVTPAPSWNTTRVHGTWNRMDGSLRPGNYKVTVPVRVTNQTNDVIIPAGVFASGTLSTTGTTSLDLQVPCTNDTDNSPIGFQLSIEVTFPDAEGELYVIDAPVGVEVNLRTIVLAASIPVPVDVLIRGVPGGLAELDTDGDVIDAAGAKVIAGGGGTTTVEGLTDATIVGKAVVKATDQTTARAAIGAAPTASPTFTGTVSGVTKAMVSLGSVDNTSDAAKPVSTAQAAALATKADLVGGVIPTSQMPPLAVNETFTAASQAAMLALTAQRGDMAIRTDTGRTFVLSTDSPATLADWKEVQAAGQVTAVAGKTGAVSLVKADVGLGSVDNTADSAKPVSTAQATALALKVPTTWGLRPRIAADSSTTVPVRATWIAANAPGYTGPVDWDLTLYLDHPGNTPGVQAAAQYAAADGVWGRTSA